MARAPTTIFNAYDDEFTAVSTDISEKISQVKTYEDDPTKTAQTMTLIDALIVQAGDLLKQMEIEVRSQPTETRRRLQNKVKTYRGTMASLERDLREAKQAQERNRLLGGGDVYSPLGQRSMDQRQRLLDANESLSNQNDALAQARRTMAETEDVALEITQELGRNREKIQSAHQRVRDVTGLTDVARRLVHSMSKRETQQRVVAYGVLFVFIGVVGFIIWNVSK